MMQTSGLEPHVLHLNCDDWQHLQLDGSMNSLTTFGVIALLIWR